MKIHELRSIVVVYLIIIFITFDSNVSFCPFYNFTHLPCPGCGMTKAIQNLLLGRFDIALKNHLFSFVVFLIILIILLTFISKKIYKILDNFLKKHKIIYLFLFLIFFYGIVRIFILIFMPDLYEHFFEKFEQKTIGEFIYEVFKNYY
jgi:hypothetical protein